MIFLRSSLMPSGMTIVHGYPLTAATKAHAMPAFPVEHSSTRMPGRRSPRPSACSNMWR
jgi:hypothetical protein